MTGAPTGAGVDFWTGELRKKGKSMPFRKGYEGIYDQATLDQLQDVLEFVWLAIVADRRATLCRENVARMILTSHESGMTPVRIKEQVVREILRKESAEPQDA
jgi:hypothetical protein